MKPLRILILGLLASVAIMLPSRGKSQKLEPSFPIAETNSQQIQALARGLQYDPVKIFNYVHDHIQYVHYFGSKKGAELTLLERSGNDFDQCALLTALLHDAGYTNTTYTFGWIDADYTNFSGNGNDLMHWLRLTLPNTNWLGTTKPYLVSFCGTRGFPGVGDFSGHTNEFLFQHVWVNLVIGGVTNHLDPSVKVSEPITGINLAAAIGINSNNLMSASVAGGTDAGNYVTNLNEANIRAALVGYTTNFLNYLQSNAPNASVQQIIGGWKIVPSTNTTLADISQNFPIPPYHWDTFYTWTYEPTDLMASVKITFAGTNYQWFMPQLQGQRVSLTFSNNGLAQLWLEDNVVAQHSASASGTTNVIFNINQPFGVWNDVDNVLVDTGLDDQSMTNACQSTNATYVLSYAFEPDWNWLQQRQNRLDNYRLQGYSDTSRQVVCETLNVMGLNWLLETASTENLLAAQLGILPQYHFRFGRMAQEAGHGYYIDIQGQGTPYPNSGLDAASTVRTTIHDGMTAYFGSAFEHGIIEQLQNSNLVAASTIKMLEVANTNKQAVYLASTTNWTAISGKLAYDPTTLNSIHSFVNEGYYVLLPQNGSNHVVGTTGWAGYGYVARLKTNSLPSDTQMIILGGYHGGLVAEANAAINAAATSQAQDSQQNAYDNKAPFTPGSTGADPVDMPNGTFQVEHTDLSIGQAEPRGITLSRYYNGMRRNSNPGGMASGWIHNYVISAFPTPAPQPGLGETTPAQAAAMIVATCTAANVYDGSNHDPKNWLVSALISKWGVDQITRNGVSVLLGKDTVQFVQQPDGSYTPPGNCTMTLILTNSAYWLEQRHGNTFKFNATGYLTNIMDQYGQSLSLTYNASNWVQTVKDWKGRQLTFNYSGTPSRLTSVTDGTRTISYGYSTSYNTQGDLTSFTDAEGKTSDYTYDTNHQIIATIDARSQMVVSNVYDAFNHVASQYTQGDTNKTWQVFWTGWQSVEQDPFGSQRTFSYDDQTRLVSMQDQLGDLTQTFYDGQSHIIATSSPLDEINQYYYDGNDNLVQSVDALGKTNQFFYDNQNNLYLSVDPLGNPTTFGYNPEFSLVGQTNGAGDWVNFAYNTTGSYPGTLATRTDSGGSISYDYDSFGQLKSATYSGGLGGVTNYNDAFGDVTNRVDGRGYAVAFQYNNRRELTNTIAPTNITVSVGFDAVGNVATNIDARKNVTSSVWSTTRHLLSTTFPATPQGAPTVTNGYDARDWLTVSADALQNPTYYSDDLAGRVRTVTDPLNRPARFTFDNDGRKLTSADAGNETNSQTWDANGHLIQLTDGAGHYSTRGYDAAGNQVTLTNRNGQAWYFYFDGANRLTNTVTPLGRSLTITLNHQGLPALVKDMAGQFTTNGFDAKGRLTNRADAFGKTLYTFDGNNNPTGVFENGTSNVWTYDAYNRVSTYRDAYGYLIQYKYDPAGNLTNLVYPGNKNVYYLYDALNRMTNVTDWSGRKTGIAYDLNGHVTSIVRPNGSYRSIGYDAAGQATNITEQMSNSLPIAIFRQGWTNTGSMAWEFAAPLPHVATVATRNMTYDADNRLSTFQGPSMGSPESVGVDNDGNLTSGPLTNDTFVTYAYDARNRLANAGGVTNYYDAANNRIGESYGTNVIAYVVNPNASLPQVLMRIKNGVTNYYVYGPGLLYQVTETATGTNTLTYHYDYRGSTIALSDDAGNVTDRIEYSLYALTTYHVGSHDTPFLFNGRFGVMTESNGLLYMRARYYNPYLCRFISQDPSGFNGGLNWFAYANGNPISYLDPFGLGAAGESALSSWIESPILNLYNLLYTGKIGPTDEEWAGATGAAGDYIYDSSPVRGAYVYGGLDAHQTTPGIGGGYHGELIGLGGYDVSSGTFAGGLGAVGTGPISTGFEQTTGETAFSPIILVDSPQTGAGQGLGGFAIPGTQGQLQVGIYFYQQVGGVGVVGGGFYFDANKLGNYLTSDYWNGTLNP